MSGMWRFSLADGGLGQRRSRLVALQIAAIQVFSNYSSRIFLQAVRP